MGGVEGADGVVKQCYNYGTQIMKKKCDQEIVLDNGQ
jgi:hypothetical protein